MSSESPTPYYRITGEESLERLNSSGGGLNAKDAGNRLALEGSNSLQTASKEPHWLTYARQFKDLMIILLVVSSILSFFLEDARTGIILFVLVFFNTTIGFLQEFKAERVMESLEKLVVPTAAVMRDGKLTEVPSSGLVRGDVVYLEEGNSVPADMRVLNEEELSTNDFALTGESNPSRKFTHAISAEVPLASRHNLVFMGTTVATGHGHAVVVATGMQTELGRIASLSQDTKKEASPLQKEMNNISTRVTQGTVILCAILLPISIKLGLPFKEAFLFAIGFASSIIPQGLPAEINTSLARAAAKLSRARALVKKLSAVESLGATDVICTDKTGTLTKNQMTVEQIMVGLTAYGVTGKGYEPEGAFLDDKNVPLGKEAKEKLGLFISASAMASNAEVTAPDNEHATWHCIGDPTEGALVTMAMKAGFIPAELNRLYPEVKEHSFDSARKRMSSIRHYGKKGQFHTFVKGAPESILERCTKIMVNGRVCKLTKKDRDFILKQNEKLASMAMRNLATAFRAMPPKSDIKKLTIDEVETDLTWLGMASMIDPLREQVPAAMKAAHEAHIKVCIVTGDYAITAKAIATRAGLAEKPEDIIVVSGNELTTMKDHDVLALAKKGGVIFSRVAPEDKLRIVGLIQDSGKVVAVTGDGINDAPALKKADIGVAMGQTGTDVAKQSAEIVLLDDSFNTLVSTVQEGRVIFQNIRKATLACFTSNSAELVVNLVSLGAATIFHVPLAISVMQILAIDLVAELFPIATLGADKADSNLMNEKPRNPRDHILNKRSILDLAWCGLLIGGLAFGNYLLFYHRNDVDPTVIASSNPWHLQAMSLTYLTIVLCQLFNILQRRSQHGLFTRYQFHNRSLWIAMGFSLLCVLIIIYNPTIAPYFQAGPLAAIDWLYAIGAAAIFVGIREFSRHDKKHRRKAVSALHHQHKHKFQHPKLAR